MYEPDTAYAPIGDRRIAYQVSGDGPTDFLLSAGYASIDAEWTHPEIALFNRRLAEVARLIRFDALGSGASDPLPDDDDDVDPIDRQIAEVIAVLDAAGSERAVVMGADSGSAAILALAARHPNRVEGVVIMHGAARWLVADDYPDGSPLEQFEAYEGMLADMDADSILRMGVPSRAGDEDFLRWGRKWLRQMTSPAVWRSIVRDAAAADVRSELPAIVAPALVVHRTGYEGIALSRYVADHVPNGRFVEIPGIDGPPWFDHPEAVLAALREFLTEIGVTAAAPSRAQRLMATVLFTDLVGSTVRAQQVGDAEWRHLLQLHEETSRLTVHSHGGRLVKTTGDGILATFDQPGNAIRCAVSLCRALGRVGLPIRAGLHTGEVELLGDDIGGVAVHIAARVMAAAGSDELLVSRTVRDLTVGSEFTYADRGIHTLKGVEGEWQLLAVTT